MPDVIQLDPTFVGAQPVSSGYSPSITLVPRPPMQPSEQFIKEGVIRRLIANGVNVFHAADALDTTAAMNAVFVGLNGLTSKEVKAQLTMHAAIQKILLQIRASGSGQPSPAQFLLPRGREQKSSTGRQHGATTPQ